MLIGTHDKDRAPEPGIYAAVIQDAVYYEPATRDGMDLPGCVKIVMALTDSAGRVTRFVDRIYLRDSTLWRLHQLHSALGLTEPMEIEKFISILPGMRVWVQITRAGQYTQVRFVPVKQVQQATPPPTPQPTDTEDQDDGDPLPF